MGSYLSCCFLFLVPYFPQWTPAPTMFLPISSTPQPERRQTPQRRHSIEKETPTSVRQFQPPTKQNSKSLVSQMPFNLVLTSLDETSWRSRQPVPHRNMQYKYLYLLFVNVLFPGIGTVCMSKDCRFKYKPFAVQSSDLIDIWWLSWHKWPVAILYWFHDIFHIHITYFFGNTNEQQWKKRDTNIIVVIWLLPMSGMVWDAWQYQLDMALHLQHWVCWICCHSAYENVSTCTRVAAGGVLFPCGVSVSDRGRSDAHQTGAG